MIKHRINLPVWIDFSLVSVVAFFISLQSSSSIFNLKEPEVDSSVWLYIASRIPFGEMPYRDSFDHKGPLLYLFEFLSVSISKNIGAWIIDLLFLTVSFILFYKISRIKNGRAESVLITVSAAAFLSMFFDLGNLVEVFAMPFITLSCYIFAYFFIKKTIKKPALILFGLSFGAVLLLRVDMVAPWCVFCLFVLADAIRNHTTNKLGSYIIFFLFGALIIIIPVLAWLYANNALLDCVNQYLLFNNTYAIYSNTADFLSRLVVYSTILRQILVLSAIVLSLLPCFKEKDIYSISLAIIIPFSAALCSLSGRLYGHYVIPLVPLCVLSISHSIPIINSHFKILRSSKWLLPVAVSAICVVFAAFSYAKNAYLYRDGMDADLVKTLSYIEEYCDEDDLITVFGNRDSIYYLSGCKSASLYSYQYPIGNIDDTIMTRYFEDLKNNRPRIVVIAHKDGWSIECGDMYEFLINNRYSQLPLSGEEFEVYLCADT